MSFGRNEVMRGIIYKIEFYENLYVGSTINLIKRQSKHNSNYKIGKLNIKLYETARENNIEKIECILLEEIEFDDIGELRKKEEEYRVKLNANLNEKACFQSEEERKEYYEKKRDEILDYHIEYYEKNKKEINEYRRGWYEKNKEKYKEKRSVKFGCDCGGKYISPHKLRHFKSKKHQDYILNNSAL
jgi:hypothetical protein